MVPLAYCDEPTGFIVLTNFAIPSGSNLEQAILVWTDDLHSQQMKRVALFRLSILPSHAWHEAFGRPVSSPNNVAIFAFFRLETLFIVNEKAKKRRNWRII